MATSIIKGVWVDRGGSGGMAKYAVLPTFMSFWPTLPIRTAERTHQEPSWLFWWFWPFRCLTILHLVGLTVMAVLAGFDGLGCSGRGIDTGFGNIHVFRSVNALHWTPPSTRGMQAKDQTKVSHVLLVFALSSTRTTCTSVSDTAWA